MGVNRKALIAVMVLFLLCLPACGGQGETKEMGKEPGLLETVEGFRGYVRSIGSEEYEFYEEIIRQQVPSDLSGEELERRTKEYASEVNAVFYLGNRLGLYEAFSFDVLKMRMEQENEERKVKLENDEVVYGLKQYDLKSYLQYEMTNLKLDIKDYILTHITEDELGDGPKEYYAENEEDFREVETITYEITADGKTETVVSDQLELRAMRNSEPMLLDFLTRSEVGDVYREPEMGYEGVYREVKLTEIQYAPMGYENHVNEVIDAYLNVVILPGLLEAIADGNPLEYMVE